MDYAFSERSNNYRKTFFDNNEPLFYGKYFCSYCGKPIKKNKITIDHLYPVNKAKKSRLLCIILKRKGFSSINDVRNLVPACKRCNSKKGTKLGFWIIKGSIGRYQKLWFVRHIVRMILLTYAVIYFF